MAKNADKVEQKDDTERESKPKRKLPLGLIAGFFRVLCFKRRCLLRSHLYACVQKYPK